MASKDGSERIEPGGDAGLQVVPGVAPSGTPRSAVQRRADAALTSQDPEVLVAQIERTREDLAATLEAIVDRVSPRNVVDRTKAQVTEVVRHKAQVAKEAVLGAASSSAATARSAAESARTAAESARTGVVAASQAVRTAALPPVTGVEVPDLQPTGPLAILDGPRHGAPRGATYVSSAPVIAPEFYAAGAVTALIAVLWIVDARRRA